jgi:hypothetical protein
MVNFQEAPGFCAAAHYNWMALIGASMELSERHEINQGSVPPTSKSRIASTSQDSAKTRALGAMESHGCTKSLLSADWLSYYWYEFSCYLSI